MEASLASWSANSVGSSPTLPRYLRSHLISFSRPVIEYDASENWAASVRAFETP